MQIIYLVISKYIFKVNSGMRFIISCIINTLVV